MVKLALALILGAAITVSYTDARAQDAKTSAFVTSGLNKALARQSKANDVVAMWQGCMKDATPCIADAKSKADKSAKRAQKRLEDLEKLAAK